MRGQVRVVTAQGHDRPSSAEKYPYVVTVDRGGFRLRYFKDLRLAKTYKIAVGQVGLETPAGLYHVQNKAVEPGLARPEQRLGRRPGRQGDPRRRAGEPAQGPLAGHLRRRRHPRHRRCRLARHAASHGCIRMAVPDVEELYDKVPVQTPVFIQ